MIISALYGILYLRLLTIKNIQKFIYFEISHGNHQHTGEMF